jgi:hypothetical protein
MARTLALLAALGALAAGCGSHRPGAYARDNTALLARVPVYPGASAPKTTSGASSSTEFGARDWTLPAAARPSTVIDWYVTTLRARGWTITGRSFDTIRATRANASLSVGVRRRTLEVIANSRGA